MAVCGICSVADAGDSRPNSVVAIAKAIRRRGADQDAARHAGGWAWAVWLIGVSSRDSQAATP